jgi:N-acetylmuramoyl-L-alanine amidase
LGGNFRNFYKPGPLLQRMDRLKDVNKIVVHHTGGLLGRIDTPDLIRLRHKWRNGWEDIGYHYVIGCGLFTKDGRIYVGRSMQFQGAHVKGHNNDSIGVVMIGNFDRTKPTERQMETLIDLLIEQCRLYTVPVERVRGHREYDSNTSCPGKNVNMNNIRGLLGERLRAY